MYGEADAFVKPRAVSGALKDGCRSLSKTSNFGLVERQLACTIPPLAPGASVDLLATVRAKYDPLKTMAMVGLPIPGSGAGQPPYFSTMCDIPNDRNCGNNHSEALTQVSAPAAIITDPADQRAAGFTAFEGRARPAHRGHRAVGAATPAVASVHIALLRITGASTRCQWLGGNGGFVASVRGPQGTCQQPTWLLAKGTLRWTYKLKKKLPPGRYEVLATATDRAGHESTPDKLPGSSATFRLR